MAINSVTASPEAVAGVSSAVHHVEATNNGPSDAQNMRIAATSNGALGAPSVACSAGGVVDGAGCTWPDATPAGSGHSADLTWVVPAGTASTTLTATHTASSDTAGAEASQTASSTILGEKSGLAITGVDAPTWSEAGLDVVHVAHAVNNGPSAADTMRLNGDHSGAFGNPTTVCSNGGIANVFTELNRARCVWLGSTPAGAERTASLTFGTPGDTPVGTPLKVAYRLTSNTTGPDATASATTLIQPTPEQADLRVSSVSAPSIWATGAALVHRIDVVNDGPGAAPGVKVGATLPNGVIAAPAVTCSTGGTPVTVDDRAECSWAADVPSGGAVWLQLSWASAAIGAVPVGTHVGSTYDTFAAAPGDHPVASSDTEILAAVANMTITGGTGPATISTAEALTHSVTAQRSGPSGAANMVLLGTYDLALGEPTTATCSSGATPNSTVPVNVGPGQRSCTYASTTGTTSRTLTLGWTAAQVSGAGVGATHATQFDVSSATAGSPATVTRNTTVTAPTATNTITGGTGPATISNAEALTHSVIANRSGPLSSDLILTGTYDQALGAPTTTCSSGTIDATVPGVRKCTFAATTTSGTNRTLSLAWTAGQVSTFGVGNTATTQFDVSSTAPGVATVSVTRSTTVTQATATNTITGGTGPASVSTADALTHSVIANRSGPLSSDLILTGTYDQALGAPTTTCSSGTIDATVPGVRKCTFAATTTSGTNRTLSLAWTAGQVSTFGVGNTATTQFDVSSTAPGVATVSVTRVTNVVAAAANMQITSLIAPEDHTAGSALVHRIDATNGGPQTSNTFRIQASHDGSLGNPTVTCSSGGVVTNVAGSAQCQWSGATAVNTARFMTLSWAVPAATPAASFPVTYTVSSADTWTVPAVQSVSTSIHEAP